MGILLDLFTFSLICSEKNNCLNLFESFVREREKKKKKKERKFPTKRKKKMKNKQKWVKINDLL